MTQAEGGKWFGKYRVVEVIGEGGMGIVYKAVNPSDGTVAAVKTVNAITHDTFSGIRREIRVLSHIRHPGIVSIQDEGVENGVPWFAMEYLQGNTLRALLRLFDEVHEQPPETCGKEISLPFILRILQDICLSLAFLHGEGVLHLDLKPENIFICEDDSVKLMDFGLVSRTCSILSREMLGYESLGMGTLEYMAPEVIKGEVVDPRADLYSLGCIFYELFTGDVPYSGKSAEDILRLQEEKRPPPPSEFLPDIPGELDELIMSLLNLSPGNRPGYAWDVVQKLKALGVSPSMDDQEQPVKLYLYRSRFVGRSECFERLKERVDGLPERFGEMVWIAGESGIGKTRLMMELANYARRNACSVLMSECLPVVIPDGAEQSSTHGSLLQAFRKPLLMIADMCREAGESFTMDVFGGAGALLSRYEPALADLPGMDAMREQNFVSEESPSSLFSAVRETLEKFSARFPVVLILDDVQWIDELSLGALRAIIQSEALETHPILIAATVRREDIDSRTREVMDSSRGFVFTLERLNEQEVEAIISEMLAISSPNPEFVRYLSAQSEGNPFFVAEYLKTAVDIGILSRNVRGRWNLNIHTGVDIASASDIPIPSALKEILEKRLDAFTEEIQEIIGVLSVLGRETSIEMLERVTDIPERELMPVLRVLRSRCIIDETGWRVLRFSHDKIREVAYQRYPQESKKTVHHKAAKILERMVAASKTEHFLEIARHYIHAGLPEFAQGYFLAAARRHRGGLAFKDSRALYLKYLSLQETPLPESIMIRIELARKVLLHEVRLNEAQAQLQTALEEAEAVGYPKAKADALLGLSDLEQIKGNIQKSVEHAHAALEIYRKAGDKSAVGDVYQRLGNAHHVQGDLLMAGDLYQRALETFKALRNLQGEGRVLSDLGRLFCETGRHRDGRRFLIRALNLQEIIRDVPGETRTLRLLGKVHKHQKKYEEAVRLLQRAIGKYRKLGNFLGEGETFIELSDVYLEQNLMNEAFEAVHYAVKLLRKAGDVARQSSILMQFARISLETGNLEQARELLAQAIELFEERGEQISEAKASVLMAETLRWMGKTARDTESYIIQAESIFRKSGDDIRVIYCLCQRGHIELADGRPGHDFFFQARNLAWKRNLREENTCRAALEKLERALKRFEAHERLIRGECPEDIPEHILKHCDARGTLL